MRPKKRAHFSVIKISKKVKKRKAVSFEQKKSLNPNNSGFLIYATVSAMETGAVKLP